MSGSAAIADLIFNITAFIFIFELGYIFLSWAKEDCKKQKMIIKKV
jgi:hypothetical protein